MKLGRSFFALGNLLFVSLKPSFDILSAKSCGPLELVFLHHSVETLAHFNTEADLNVFWQLALWHCAELSALNGVLQSGILHINVKKVLISVANVMQCN